MCRTQRNSIDLTPDRMKPLADADRTVPQAIRASNVTCPSSQPPSPTGRSNFARNGAVSCAPLGIQQRLLHGHEVHRASEEMSAKRAEANRAKGRELAAFAVRAVRRQRPTRRPDQPLSYGHGARQLVCSQRAYAAAPPCFRPVTAAFHISGVEEKSALSSLDAVIRKRLSDRNTRSSGKPSVEENPVA